MYKSFYTRDICVSLHLGKDGNLMGTFRERKSCYMHEFVGFHKSNKTSTELAFFIDWKSSGNNQAFTAFSGTIESSIQGEVLILTWLLALNNEFHVMEHCTSKNPLILTTNGLRVTPTIESPFPEIIMANFITH